MAAFGIPSLSPELEATIAAGLSETESLLNSRIEGRYLFANETSRHLVAAGGKRFRPLITLLGSLIGSGINEKVIKAAAVCELTHLATLYHDDVMDEAPLRRGQDYEYHIRNIDGQFKIDVYYCGCNLFGMSSDYESEVVFSGSLPEFIDFCNVTEDA